MLAEEGGGPGRGGGTPGRATRLGCTRHGHNPGSVRGWVASGIRCGCARVRQAGPGEVRLASYERLHGAAGGLDEGSFGRCLAPGISCRDYTKAAVRGTVPGAIGLSKSTVSREFQKATAAQLQEFPRSGTSRRMTWWRWSWTARASRTTRSVRRARRDAPRGQGLPRVRPDGHGEQGGDPVLPPGGLKDRGLDLSAGALVR